MEALQELIRSLLLWLGLIAKPDFLMRAVTDHPSREQMEPGWIYVVGGPGYQKWAYLFCPTGNGEVIQLSLQPNHRPRWHVGSDFLGRPTVNPSVRQLEGSYAHFWIRSGRVHWCEDTGRRPMVTQGSWQA